jgi:hypothetical protein
MPQPSSDSTEALTIRLSAPGCPARKSFNALRRLSRASAIRICCRLNHELGEAFGTLRLIAIPTRSVAATATPINNAKVTYNALLRTGRNSRGMAMTVTDAVASAVRRQESRAVLDSSEARSQPSSASSVREAAAINAFRARSGTAL